MFPLQVHWYETSYAVFTCMMLYKMHNHLPSMSYSKSRMLFAPQESYIITEQRIVCLHTGHLGAKSRSTDKAHRWQQTRCPHGTNADRLLLIRQITHNCPSGTSPVSSSALTCESASLLAEAFCCWTCLWCLRSFHLFQFLKQINMN